MIDIAKLKGKKVVIVEDDKFLGGMVSKKLISTGCEVTLEERGDQAVATIEKTSPHIILLDLFLPGMTGFDVLREIRSKEKFKNTPVIILSNLGGEEDIQKGKDLGAKDYLIKATVSMDEIAEHVARNL